MKITLGAYNTHKWTRYRYAALRLILMLGSLVSLLLAAGANGKWL